MRTLLLALLVVAPSFAAEEAALQKAVKLFHSKDAAAREQGSRTADAAVRKLLAPLLKALEDPDPEVRRRARRSILGLLPGELEKEENAQAAATRQVILGGLQGLQVKLARGQLRQVNLARGQLQVVQAALQAQVIQRALQTEVQGELRRFGIELKLVAAGRKAPGGLRVRRVHQNSTAAGFGLRAGDTLLEVNGKKVANFEQLHGALGKKPAWGKVKLRVLRRGRQIVLPIIR